MRLAGTWIRYSNSAMPQENSAAIHHGFSLRCLEVGVPGEGHENIRHGQQRSPSARGPADVKAEEVHSRAIPWLATAGSQALMLPRPGMFRSGAISASGSSTKARRCRRGWGRVRRGRANDELVVVKQQVEIQRARSVLSRTRWRPKRCFDVEQGFEQGFRGEAAFPAGQHGIDEIGLLGNADRCRTV